jgi:RimJ/RimL family protein N-acetyltransferase
MATARQAGTEKGARKVSVMERILIFIKHHFKFLWKIIDLANGLLFSILFKSRLEAVLTPVFKELAIPPFLYRRLKVSDTEPLYDLIKSQKVSDLEFFSPHSFDLKSIKNQFMNRSFYMMGAFDKEKIVGYFFLRFFANKKCFVGRLIDKDYRGKGIGFVMNIIMYETAWRMGFRCFSTISRNNSAIMHAHAKNPTMVVVKELQNDYLLVEFVRDTLSSQRIGRMRAT